MPCVNSMYLLFSCFLLMFKINTCITSMTTKIKGACNCYVGGCYLYISSSWYLWGAGQENIPCRYWGPLVRLHKEYIKLRWNWFVKACFNYIVKISQNLTHTFKLWKILKLKIKKRLSRDVLQYNATCHSANMA